MNNYAIDAIEPVDRPRKASENLEGMVVPVLPLPPRTTDVLASASAQPAPVSFDGPSDKPKLSPPSAPSQFRFIKAMNAQRELNKKVTDQQIDRVNEQTNKIKKKDDAHLAKLQKQTDKAANSDSWSAWHQTATSVNTAFTYAGAAYMATAGHYLVAAALVFSGLTAMADFALSKAEVYDKIAEKFAQGDEEKRQHILFALRSVTAATSMGLAVYGAAHRAFTLPYLSQNLMKVITMGVTTFDATTTLGQGLAQSSLVQSQAESMVVRDDLNQMRLLLQMHTQGLTSVIASGKDIQAHLGKMADIVTKEKLRTIQA